MSGLQTTALEGYADQAEQDAKDYADAQDGLQTCESSRTSPTQDSYGMLSRKTVYKNPATADRLIYTNKDEECCTRPINSAC